MDRHDIIVIGASAGGVQALQKLVEFLRPDLPAAVFVVVHVSPGVPSFLPEILNRKGAIQSVHARDGERIALGRIYVAPPNRHLLLQDHGMVLSDGPRENRSRPAVDPLFRSAARFYGPRVVGIVLTGLLGDGSAGLALIKKCGGVTIVQDPLEASFPDMPLKALQRTAVDHCLSIEAMPALLAELAPKPAGRKRRCPAVEEVQIMARKSAVRDRMREDAERNGDGAQMSCPDCMGPMWELEDRGVVRYRCQVGHAFGPEAFQAGQDEQVERALWTAVSALQDKAALARRLHARKIQGRLDGLTTDYEAQAKEALEQADLIRGVLSSITRKPEVGRKKHEVGSRKSE